jgi:hypothetical protein
MDLQNRGVKMVRRFWVLLLIILTGCGLNTTRRILPVADQDVAILPRTRGAVVTKTFEGRSGGVSFVVVPLERVKEMDAFGILIVNETSNWISFKKEDIMLIQSGEARYPTSDTQVYSRLGGGHKPSMPNELNADIYYDWRPSVNTMVSRGFQIVDEEKKLSVMGGTKEKIFLYFKTQSDTSPMQLIIPNVYNEATKQRLRFSFKFVIEER